jgi:hypothetical protein
MLAFAWPWTNEDGQHGDLSGRLGASLCAGLGGHAGTAEHGGLHFAYRPLRPNRALSMAWRPTILPSGRIVAFHGYFDNAAAIAAELGASQDNPARLYGLADAALGRPVDGGHGHFRRRL